MNDLIIFGAKYLTGVMILISFGFFLKLPRAKKIEMAIFGIITLPTIYLIARFASLMYFNPRPFVVGNFTPLIEHANNNGFPSDHALLSSAVAMVVYFFNKKFGIFLLLLTFLVGISRVFSGVHHIIDILASISIAVIVSFAMHKYVLPKLPKQRK